MFARASDLFEVSQGRCLGREDKKSGDHDGRGAQYFEKFVLGRSLSLGWNGLGIRKIGKPFKIITYNIGKGLLEGSYYREKLVIG